MIWDAHINRHDHNFISWCCHMWGSTSKTNSKVYIEEWLHFTGKTASQCVTSVDGIA